MQIIDYPVIRILTNVLLRTPLTIKFFLMLTIFGFLIYLYKFYLVGILLCFLLICVLFRMLEHSVNLNNFLDYELLKKQALLFIAMLFLIGNIIYYVYQIESIRSREINWKPVYFEYAQYNSTKYPSSGWFSGKHKGEKFFPETFTDAIGFGFPLIMNNCEEPILFMPDMKASFILRYTLSITLLIGAIFEDKNDNNLTEPYIFFLHAALSENTLTLKSKDFHWLRQDEIKHLKFNYVLLPMYDEIFVKILLFFNLDNVVKDYYLRAH